MFNILFFICDNAGFLKAMALISTILTIVRFAIPLGLILWVSIDLFKNMVNPDNKNGVQKIGIRLGAAIIIFLVPTIIKGVLNLFDYVTGNIDYKASNCFTNANSSCITKIDSYLNCEDGNYTEEEKNACIELRSCNSYKLDSSCNVTTDLNDSMCSQYNNENGSYKYIK